MLHSLFPRMSRQPSMCAAACTNSWIYIIIDSVCSNNWMLHWSNNVTPISAYSASTGHPELCRTSQCTWTSVIFEKSPKTQKHAKNAKNAACNTFFEKSQKTQKCQNLISRSFAEFRGVSRGPPRTPKTPKNRSHAVRGVSRSFAEFRGVSRGGLCAIIDIFEKMVDFCEKRCKIENLHVFGMFWCFSA